MGPLVRLITPEWHPSPDARWLRSDDFLAFREANQIVAEARQESERIRADAQKKANSIIVEAEKAYEEQKRAGYEEGLNKALEESAGRMLDTVEYTIDYLSYIEDKVVSIVLTALRKILGEFNDTERLVCIVRNALQVFCNQKHVIVRVSPHQIDEVKKRVNDILAAYSEIRYLEIVPDSRLTDSGCILETDIGSVNASLDMQIQILEKALTSRFRTPS